MEHEIIEADVLCVGGGIAGLMAAIRASELGAKVVVAEKGNTLSSGGGGTGNDHFECYIPEVHGPDREAFIQELLRSQRGEQLHDMDMIRTHRDKSYEIVKLWDSWGIPMRYKGKWEFSGHAFPGHIRTRLRFEGKMQKTVLTEQAVQRGVKILNRVMVFDLLQRDGAAIGALAISTRDDRIIVFKIRAVVLGTGRCSRLYPAPVPGMMFNLSLTRPTCTGDGRAMAYRAGAELRNIEMLRRHTGPKYFSRAGQASWVGVLRDSEGNAIGTFVNKPDTLHGDITPELNKLIPEQYVKAGKGPVYMDCTGISDEDYEYMMHWMRNEGITSLVDHFNTAGIDFRKNPVEFMTYEMRLEGGVAAKANTETALKGLYAAGDEMGGGGIAPAATFGWISGENAAAYSPSAKTPDINGATTKIEEFDRLVEQIRGRENGADWQEANIALQQTMQDYCGSIRYESLLEAGINHLRRLKENVYSTISARSSHELTRCLEVLNLLELGEILFIAAGDRKETRGLHVRPDYPFTNPLLNAFHVIKQINGKPVTAWQQARH